MDLVSEINVYIYYSEVGPVLDQSSCANLSPLLFPLLLMVPQTDLSINLHENIVGNRTKY